MRQTLTDLWDGGQKVHELGVLGLGVLLIAVVLIFGMWFVVHVIRRDRAAARRGFSPVIGADRTAAKR
jgi:hypothetical protein